MRSVNIQRFNPRRVPRGTKKAVYLNIAPSPSGQTVRNTALLIGGDKPGPLLVVVAGLHGDEYEGPYAIMRLFQELEPADLRGTLVAVTMANVLAFETVTRETAIDGVNMNRAFPGDPRGSVTQQIAYWIGERLVRRADFCIDFHSGGRSDIPILCAFGLDDGPLGETNQKVAHAFGAPVTLAHKEFPPNLLEGHAAAHSVPLVFTECPSPRGLNLEAAAIYQRGARNTMRILDMLDGDLEGDSPEYVLYDMDNEEAALSAGVGGFFVSERQVLEEVHAGDLLGQTCDFAGNVLEEFRAPMDGYVLLRRWGPTIHAGDELVFSLVGDEKTW